MERFVDRLECPHNVDIPLEERLYAAERENRPYDLFVNDYYWVFVDRGHYEFYYNPEHFMGKIASEQIPSIVRERIQASCAHFPLPENYVRGEKRFVSIPYDRVSFRTGNWFYAQGYNFVTMNKKVYADEGGYSGTLCVEYDLQDMGLWDFLRSNPSTITHHTIKGIFDLPCFRGVDCSAMIVKPLEDEKWDSKQWVKWFEHEKPIVKRGLRQDVFRHTVFSVRSGYYISESGTRIELPDPTHLMQNTVFIDQELFTKPPESVIETKIDVVNQDTLTAAKELLDAGYHPAALNMASRQNPGGGVFTGAGAQEENLFRRTNLFMSMYQFADYASQYGIRRAVKHYPLDRNYGGVYSPGVTVFRGEESMGYPLLDTYYQVDIISVAGMNHPQLNEEGEIVPSLVPGIKNKIRTILRIGILQRNDALVLGALGCGAFGNPPAQIAHLFHEVLDESEFQNRFSKIRFAILEDHNSIRNGQEEGNFLPFLREFS